MAERRANREGSIYQRKDADGNPIPGKWVAQIKVDGKRHTFVGKTRSEVYFKLGRYKTTPPPLPEKNYGEFLNEWLELKRRQLKDSSFDRLECTVNNNVLPYVSRYRISELDYDILQEVINRLQDEGKSDSTIKKAYEAMNASLRFASFPCKLLRVNPMLGVKVPPKSKFDGKATRALTIDEIHRLKDAAAAKWGNGASIYPLGAAVTFMLNTGLRAGEAIALKWQDYNETKALLYVRDTIKKVRDREQGEHVWKHQRQSVKTASSRRFIPLNKEALRALEEIRAMRYFGENSAILAQADGTPNTMDNFARTFEAIAARAGIKDCSLHTLRHTFATQMLYQGVDIKVVSSILGHASIGITYDLYVHVLDEIVAQAMVLVDEI